MVKSAEFTILSIIVICEKSIKINFFVEKIANLSINFSYLQKIEFIIKIKLIMKSKIFTIISIFLITTFIMSAEIKSPDFAYPKQVAKDSEKQLKSAIKRGDDPAVLRAIMNLTLAQSQVSNTSLSENLHKIQEIKDADGTSPALKAMSALVMVDIYKSIYSENRWTYDNRQLPLLPLPKNYDEWSGEHFKSVILELIKEAVSEKEALLKVGICDYSSVLNFDNDKTKIYYPTLYDFVANYAISFVSDLFIIRHFTKEWLCTSDEFIQKTNDISDENVFSIVLKRTGIYITPAH